MSARGFDKIAAALPAAKVRPAQGGGRALRTRCPACGVREALAVDETAAGALLVNCFGHCGDREAPLRGLGLSWADVLPASRLTDRLPSATPRPLVAAVNGLRAAHDRLLGEILAEIDPASDLFARLVDAFLRASASMREVEGAARSLLRRTAARSRRGAKNESF